MSTVAEAPALTQSPPARTAVPVKPEYQPAAPGVSGPQAAPTTIDQAEAVLKQFDEAAGHSPLRTEAMKRDARELITQKPGETKPSISRAKLAAFLEKYYEIDRVTGKFWAAFTGLGEDAVIDYSRLQYCLTMFAKYHKYTGSSLKYMAEHKNIYIVPFEGLKNELKTYPGGISALLKAAEGNPLVKQAWESAKALAQDKASDDEPHGDETYKWFAIILSNSFADKISSDKIGKSKDIEDLDLDKNSLLVSFYDKYLLRWMVGEDLGAGQGRQNICFGISDAEWSGLLDKQSLIASLGKKYFRNNEINAPAKNALKDLRLPNKKAEALWAEAVKLYENDNWAGDNKTKVQLIIGQIRKIMDGANGKAAPSP